MLFIPGNRAIDTIHDMCGLAKPMSFPWVADKNCFDANILKSYEKLLRFSDRHIRIVFSMYEHRRRGNRSDMFECGALPKQVHQIALMRKLPEFHLFVLIVVSHVVIADLVGPTGSGNRSTKHSCLRNKPLRELTTVALTFNSHAFPVEPQIPAKS